MIEPYDITSLLFVLFIIIVVNKLSGVETRSEVKQLFRMASFYEGIVYIEYIFA